jgi:hypothetical protein
MNPVCFLTVKNVLHGEMRKVYQRRKKRAPAILRNVYKKDGVLR